MSTEISNTEEIYISRTMTGKEDSISLAEKLERQSATLSKSEMWYNMIHKVHPSLRTINEKDYEPSLVSIGPYHHGSKNLQEMEKYKVRMLHLLLVRTEKSLENYMESMRGIKEEALRYYASTISMDGDKFIEMLILDGCFILEFLRNVREKPNRDKLAFNMNLLMPDIFRDLVLFENQLPLSVLSKLFELTKVEVENFDDLITVFVYHFCFHYIGEKESSWDTDKIKNSPHLLHLVYMTCKKSTTRKDPKMKTVDDIKLLIKSDNERNFHIKSATTLEESGVVFKKAEQGVKLRDIIFTKNGGVLKIPQLMISDRTETIFRNLVAYENYIEEYDFTNYMFFMDCLINSPKDVELLRHRGIIENMLGDDEYVSLMFNKICSYVVAKISTDSEFDKLCQDINEYSARRCNKWMAKLRHQYFSSPWSFISFFAAFVLLGLTMVQTMFSIMSYTNPKIS